MMYSISFVFDEKKAAQAACYLLSLYENESMNCMKMIKILYLSDRRFIEKYSSPITTDRYVSMDDGPVTSNIYDLVKNSRDRDAQDGMESIWTSCLYTEGYDIKMKRTFIEYDMLSPMEMEVIEDVDREFRDKTEMEVVEYCHKNLEEWQNPFGSSIPISMEDIVRAAKNGRDADEIICDLGVAASIQKRNYLMLNRIRDARITTTGF